MKGEYKKIKRGIRFALLFTAILWLVKGYEFISSTSFEAFGILPRTLRGSVGIITAPLIHGDIYHLISNTFPILILVIGIFYFYSRIAPMVFFLIYFMTGFWVWIAARDAYHIGASGLVYGLISFLLFSGFFRKEIKTLAVSFVVLILYGSNMVYGLIPGNEKVSWESHLLGVVAGLFCAIYFKPNKRPVASSQERGESDRETGFITKNFYTFDTKIDSTYFFKKQKAGKDKTFGYTIVDGQIEEELE